MSGCSRTPVFHQTLIKQTKYIYNVFHQLNLSPVNNLFLVPPVRWKGAGLSPQWSKCRLTAADSQSVLCRINLKDVLALGWSAADPSVTRTCRYLVLQLHKKNSQAFNKHCRKYLGWMLHKIRRCLGIRCFVFPDSCLQ